MKLKNTEEISKDHAFQYVSILKTIEVLLWKENVQKYVLSSGDTENDGLICEFKDGLIYENNPLWTSSNKTIYIVLYCDEFVCANPLGNKVKKYKISAIYFVLGNLPRKKRSMLSSINLAILCKTTFIEKHGYESVLAPLIKDLETLEQKGVSENIDGVSHTFFGSLSLINGDNLAQHSLGGFFESFSNVKRVCRYCSCHRNNFKAFLNDEVCQKRTVEVYNENINDIIENPELRTIYGIKRSSEFNTLEYFHIIGQQPFDLHHDVFEGAAVDVMSNLIKYSVRCVFFSSEFLNEMLTEFNYADCDKVDKPQFVYKTGS